MLGLAVVQAVACVGLLTMGRSDTQLFVVVLAVLLAAAGARFAHGRSSAQVHAFTRVGGGRHGVLIVHCIGFGLWLFFSASLLVAGIQKVGPCAFLVARQWQEAWTSRAAGRSVMTMLAAAAVMWTWSCVSLRDETEDAATEVVAGVVALAVAVVSELMRAALVFSLTRRAKLEDNDAGSDSDAAANYVAAAATYFAVLFALVALGVSAVAGADAAHLGWSTIGFVAILLPALQTADIERSSPVKIVLTAAVVAVSAMLTLSKVTDALLSLGCLALCFASLSNRTTPRADPPPDCDPAHLFVTDWGTLRRLTADPTSKKLLIFLVINLTFTAVELVTGVKSNSLGLISDAFHMLMDSSSVAIGLYAALLSSLPPSETYPYGHGRSETLSAFVNGALLLMLAAGTLVEAVARLIEPQSVEGIALLPVSIGGLLVNIVGVVFFHEAHSHGHTHSHGDHNCCGHSDSNLKGVYYHVLADLFGSIGVITSTVIIRVTGFTRADAICSLVVVCLITFAAIVLIKESASMLLLKPSLEASGIEQLTANLQALANVKAVRALTTWVHCESAGDVAKHAFVILQVAAPLASPDGLRAEVSTLVLRSGAASSIDALTIEFCD